MEENQKKNIGKALTTDEIRLHASKWTLAGDAGLLAHLEQFSQNLQSKSQETQNNINALYDAFGDASSTINNVTNQFLALQNSQFVENRVYDDESPNEEQKIDEKVSEEEQEKSLLAQYKRAVELGVKILDTHFEEVQLPPNSDSEEEEEEEGTIENSGLVWKSKNLYARKRFPLLIGSAEWWADDNVGLGDYEENINTEVLSSESESDLDEENTDEKHIRMSSSSSTESERILSKKPKEQIGSEYNDIFAPVGKDLLNVKSNILSEDNSKLIKSQNVRRVGENINPLNLPLNDGEEGNSYLPKQDKNYIFDDNEDGNSVEDISSQSKVPATKQIKISNSFTRELESKLSSVANKNIKEQSHKNTQHVESEKEEKSALFDDNDDDNDDLFSTQNSAPNAFLRKKSIFSEEDDDDQLFGNSGNLFSDSKKGATLKKSVKISTPVEKNGSVSKENNRSNLFDKSEKFSNDNLFDGNDDFLFSGKSGLSSSHNSGAPHIDWKTSRDVKFSTPTEQGCHQEVPSGDIFGGVSEIRSNASSNVESVSAVGHEIDNSFNFSRFSSADNSKDYGFVEPSDFSNNKSRKVESPGLFDPLLTSTRHVASDTSDYKTHRTTPSQIIQTKSESSVPRLQDNFNSRMGHSENAHFSRYQSDVNKNKGLFDEDDDDDLFQTNKLPNPVKHNLFDDNENDNLFGSALPKVEKHKSILQEKEENAVVSQKPSLPPVEDDEEGKFSLVDKLKQDSVSMSSSRSSLFDDANMGKTNLASVFDNDKLSKNSNDLFGQTDENVFEEKKTKSFGEHSVEDLFGDNAVTETKTNISSSLFDDLEDADDLFRDNVSKKPFEYRNDDNADLFGNPLKDNDKNSSTQKAFGIIQRKDDTVIGSKPSPENKIEPNTTAKKFSDNIFGESKKLVKNVSVSANADKIMVKDAPKPKSSAVSSLFGELEDEDEDEDLFSNVKNRENKKSTENIFEEPVSGIKSKGLVNDDAIFKVGNSKEKVTASAEVEGECITYDEPVNKELSCYNGKTEMSLSSDEKSEEKKSISAISTSNSSNNGKNDLFSGKENLLDSRTSNLGFSENEILKTGKKVVEVNENSFHNSTVDDEKLFEEKTGDGIKSFPPNSLKLDLVCNQDNNSSETDGLIISSEKEKVIGKLNIPAGLKINPMCLLPGATIKKNVTAEDLKKETTEEEERENLGSIGSTPLESASNLLKCLSKDRVKIQTRRRPQTRRARHEALRSSGIDFEVNTQEIASVTSRSRSVDDFEKSAFTPSAIKSSSDTNVNDPVLVNSVNEMDKVMENADSSSSVFHSVENSPEGLFSSPMFSNPLSPSTDGEDYFNVPELDMNFEKEDQSIFQSNLNDFKNIDNTDDNLLFDSAPVVSSHNPDGSLIKKEKKLEGVTITSDVITEKITDSKIAFDEQDEDNLFKVDEAKSRGTVGEKKSENKFTASNIFDDSDEGDSFLFQKKPISILSAKEVNKKTLFDDNDEDDDLFNDKLDSRNIKSKTTIESVSKNQVNKSNVADKSKEPFIDPLGLITKPG